MGNVADMSGSFFADLIQRRRRLIDALDANKEEVNLDIFEDFYPDKAHFVYELLQNAEDADATEVSFTLDERGLVFEHNGDRLFTEADVSSITGIHNSTKAKEEKSDKIGKFGVGFKSVFVYTQSPTIRSGKFAFRIVKLILPELISPDEALGKKTRFEFPFDNPKKPPVEAHQEIAAGLRELDETTLLFLSNLESIKWTVDGSSKGEVLRHQHGSFHIEVLKQEGEKTTSSSHFLKFEEIAEGLERQTVAVAFPLDFLAGVRSFDGQKPIAEQMRIVPASPGRVAVFFPASKEYSGLSFHLHGPFVPELSRASIKETRANEPLFRQVAQLAAGALHDIRELGLLTVEFLSVLPTPQDQIPVRYEGIRTAIFEEMRLRPLTPTHRRDHAAAVRLIQAKASLKELLSDEDIEFLVTYDEHPPLWAISATQKNSRTDNFLAGLGIREWGADEFIEALKNGASTSQRFVRNPPHWVSKPDQEFMAWLKGKSIDWMRQFYAVLHDELGDSLSSHELRDLEIVRLRGGTLGVASKAYFPTQDGVDRGLPVVDEALYSSGRSKSQQEKARKFLLELGVREIGEAEEVEIVLNTRYTKEAEIPNERTYAKDLKSFVALIEKQPEKKSLFKERYIFQGADSLWYTPDAVYLDSPYKATDLSAYFCPLSDKANRQPLHERYLHCGIAPDRLGKFAETVGATTKLAIERISCSTNPEWGYLRKAPGERNTSPINRDFYIANLSTLLSAPNVALSRLVWRTVIAIPEHSDVLRAMYRHNATSGAHIADSRLVHELRAAKWIPQADGTFVSPEAALRDRLPTGFPFDAGYAGLKAIKFGDAAIRKAREGRQMDDLAKAVGLPDGTALERARRFANLPAAEQEEFLFDRENAARLAAVPDREPANPTRRAQNVAEQARRAPEKESEIRNRSVSIGREESKDAAKEYLRLHYRNANGDMTCQICKGPLPFKLDDGSDFFETVEFLPVLGRRHAQNYLALCPNHAAMYQHANSSKEDMRSLFSELSGNELDVVLGQSELTIYFSKVHQIDLKAVIEVENELLSKPSSS